MDISRRTAIGWAIVTLSAGVARGRAGDQERDGARLRARPRRPPRTEGEPGLHALGIARGRDGVLYVPARYAPDAPLPCALMLHGAGSRGEALAGLFDIAESSGVIVVAPDSRGRTWDAIHDRHAEDAAFIDRTLRRVFDRYSIDGARVAIGGFSDGASHALSLGLANGDLFGSIIAFSPGFIPRASRRGRPRVFISHGTDDRVLPIDRTSRRIVALLDADGYAVEYHEFEGGHTVPPDAARAAFDELVA